VPPNQPELPEPIVADGKPADAPLAPGAVLTAVEPASTIPAPPVEPPPATGTAEGSATSPPTLTGATAAALAKPGSTHVTVKTVPAGAAIFQAGKRLGTGLVELDVEPNMKHRLTALLDGHRPMNFTVDGSRDTVTIMLKPVARVAPRTSDPAASEATEGTGEAEKRDEAPAAPPPAEAAPDPFAAP
jgi:hypothetical protein